MLPNHLKNPLSDREREYLDIIEALLSQADPLTGLLTRAGFEAKAKGLGQYIYLDVDGLKALNDGFKDHAAGDTLIRSLGDVIRANVRPQDVAGRLGGDEFAIFIPAAENINKTLSDYATTIATRIEKQFGCKDLSRYYLGNSSVASKLLSKMTPRVSWGVGTTLQAADHSMYITKSSRKGSND